MGLEISKYFIGYKHRYSVGSIFLQMSKCHQLFCLDDVILGRYEYSWWKYMRRVVHLDVYHLMVLLTKEKVLYNDKKNRQ